MSALPPSRLLVRSSLVLALALAGCSSAPELPGARLKTRHYDLATDSTEPLFARRVGRLAERLHDRLASDFGTDPSDGPIPLLVCTQRAAFDRELGTGDQRDPSAIQGSCEPGRRIVVLWSDDAQGAQALAHELVHRFVHAFEPDAPGWLDEGLARALALGPTREPPTVGLPPRTDLAHPVVARRMPDAELWTRLDALPREEFRRDSDFFENAQNHDVTDCVVAAALVRYGLETQGWKDLASLVQWKPDKQAFLAWLRSVTPATRFEHFSPLELALDPEAVSPQKNP